MDILKILKPGLTMTLAVWLALFPWQALASLTTKTGMDPYQRVYDYADIFADNEEEELRGIARRNSELLGVHFVILSIDDASVDNLERYCDEFYLANIAGVDGIYDCAFMQINMGTRRVANRYYGELRTMISDREADVISDGYGGYMSGREYGRAARYFLNEAAKLVGAKLEEYRVETPAVDPDKLIYDFDGVLSDEEHGRLYDAARDIADKTGVGHVVVILGEDAEEGYLQRYARSFYRRNFQDAGLYDGGVFVLAVSAGSRTASATPYGAYMPKNDELWEMNRSVQSKLRNKSVYSGCGYFLYDRADAWHEARFEMPKMDTEESIHDFAGVLTEKQTGDLRALIRENYEKYGVDIKIVYSDIEGSRTLGALRSGLFNLFYRGNNGILIIGSPPGIEKESRYVDATYYGHKTGRKIGLNQERDIERKIRDALDNNGDYYGAGVAFVKETARAMSSLIPNVRMADEIGWALQVSLLTALGLPLLVVLILRIAHGFGMKRKISARNYLVRNSVKLYYSGDIFLHTHTTRTERVKDTDSGGSSGGGSSGGGISSGSERSF